MNIAYVGQLWEGGTCRMRMRALEDLGHDVISVDTTDAWSGRRWSSVIPRVLKKCGYPCDFPGANAKIREITSTKHPKILWVDKGLSITPETLRAVRWSSPRTLIISYSPDDMARAHNQSRYYVRGIREYDVHFTTKTHNLKELRLLGARRVLFVRQGYDPHTHKPVGVSEETRVSLGGSIGFIGAFELDRCNQMLGLGRAGFPVRIWGEGWDRWRRHPNLKVERGPLWGRNYAKAICSFDINLGFLRRMNRDKHTTRSIEIPACGGFMLAERTDEHLALFEEGREAEFFGSTEELIEKVRFYLRHESERKEIARAGRERCLRSGYDYRSRMQEMLSQVV